MWPKLLYMSLAGALGTLARYGLSGVVQRWTTPSFPWGTTAVNLLGCFIFGFVWELTSERFSISGELRICILIGFLGAFTKFSSFIFESGKLLADGELLIGIGYMLIQNVFGLALFFTGLVLARWV